MIDSFNNANNFKIVGRLAPSPTARMHAGNIFAALLAWIVAKSRNGEMVLRIEDLDPERSKTHFADMVQRDFETLGLTWDRGPFFQHDRQDIYYDAFCKLKETGLVYPCFCTRSDLRAVSAPHFGDKSVYPGTCKYLSEKERDLRAKMIKNDSDDPRKNPAMRLSVDNSFIEFNDLFQGSYSQVLDRDCGDFIIRRSDGAFAYQLAVVIDDFEQGISSVVRGIDLLSSTPQQIYLQNLLGFTHPFYAHIPLFVAENGRRLSKRDKDCGFDALLDRFKTPQGIIGHIAYIGGIISEDEPITPTGILKYYDEKQLCTLYRNKISIRYES